MYQSLLLTNQYQKLAGIKMSLIHIFWCLPHSLMYHWSKYFIYQTYILTWSILKGWMLSVGSLCVVVLQTILPRLDGQLVTGVTITVTCHGQLLIVYLNILPCTRMNLIGYIGLEICQRTMFGTKLGVNSWNCCSYCQHSWRLILEIKWYILHWVTMKVHL